MNYNLDNHARNSPPTNKTDKYFMKTISVFLMLFSFFLLFAILGFDRQDMGFTGFGQNNEIINFTGSMGAYISDGFLYFFGFVSYILIILLWLLLWNIIKNKFNSVEVFSVENSVNFFAILLLTIIFCSILGLHFAPSLHQLPSDTRSGGLIGSVINFYLLAYFGIYALTLLQLVATVILITVISHIKWLSIFDYVGAMVMGIMPDNSELNNPFNKIKLPEFSFKNNDSHQQPIRTPRDRPSFRSIVDKVISKKEEEPPLPQLNINTYDDDKKYSPKEKVKIEPNLIDVKQSKKVYEQKQIEIESLVSDEQEQKYLPALSLLDVPKPQKQSYSSEALEAMSNLLEIKLKEFNITATVVAVHPGPIITRFELKLAPGLKVTTVSNLARDIARSMAVMSVRVVEVIAGKSTIGLEIPNESRELVYLSEIIKSQTFDVAKSPLTIALGKDIAGNPVTADLGKMPHLLVAGTTGSGKSVAVNAMILSLLYKSTPAEVRLILIDPKMLELSVYNGIGHLLTPVVTDMKEAANALRWCVAEMERRYKYMAKQKVRNIAGYNKVIKDSIKDGNPIRDHLFKKINPEDIAPQLDPLPYIVVVVDEFADLMMVVGKKVEELIARIAQKARAAGIHLILATQRPSVDVVTGLIKANIPTRIAFQVSSKIDSRTILDQQGAEQLLGHGDMLYLPPGTSLPERVHGAFVDDHEVNSVVEDLKQHNKDYQHIDMSDEIKSAQQGSADAEADDELYDEAVKIVTSEKKGSISYLQRRLNIGYNRAANIIEALERAGVVSAPQNNGTREVLAPAPPQD
ncbi:MAG: hypothetical protein DRQ51_03740 [Gammaproteobacteria bacterium]|nr:MAG: hypothetical protein DRQ51_03740 [Gammaproteobacteria bacterium]